MRLIIIMQILSYLLNTNILQKNHKSKQNFHNLSKFQNNNNYSFQNNLKFRNEKC